MKFFKSFTLGLFILACTFTFVGCDLFNNQGTLIENPTNEQLNNIETAITNTSTYSGDVTIVNVATIYNTNTVEYDDSSYSKNIVNSTIKIFGTGDNYKASKIQKTIGSSHSINLDYTTTVTSERYISKIGNYFTYINKNEETIKKFDTLSEVKTYSGFTSIFLLNNISNNLNDLSIYSGEALKVYALDNADTSYIFTLSIVEYAENNETTALTKSTYEIEIKIGTINNVMMITYCKITSNGFKRDTVADEWVSANIQQTSETNYDYVTSSIIIPDASNYEEDV